jgi:hypothetical protein
MIISSYFRYFLELDNFNVGKRERRGEERRGELAKKNSCCFRNIEERKRWQKKSSCCFPNIVVVVEERRGG